MQLLSDKIPCIFVTCIENIFYLTGFRGSFGLLLITPKKTTLITDSRYTLRAKKEVRKGIEIIDLANLKKEIQKYTEIGFEANHITVARLKKMKKDYPQIKWIPKERVIETLRMKKSETEIKLMQKAATMAEAVLKNIIKKLKTGMTEKEVEWKIREYIRDEGGDDVSFPPIVAFGEHSAIPHHEVTDRKLKKGDMILLDFGVKYQGYCSDMTRVFFTKKPTEKQREIYETVLKAQETALEVIKPGMKLAEIDKAAREVIEKAGYGKEFGHSLGHGVGVEIHEGPGVSPKAEGVVEEGMVITVEPGIYVEGLGGVRIEDMVVVTKGGCRNFVKAKKGVEVITLS